MFSLQQHVNIANMSHPKIQTKSQVSQFQFNTTHIIRNRYKAVFKTYILIIPHPNMERNPAILTDENLFKFIYTVLNHFVKYII